MYQKVLGRLFGLPSVASIRVSRRMSSFPFGGIDEMGTGIVLAYAQSGALPAVAPSNASQPPAAPPAPVPTVTEVPAPSSHAIGSFPPDEDPSVFLALVRALEGAGISHTVTIHTPVRTSEEVRSNLGKVMIFVHIYLQR